jgi:hypothetical protein
VFRPHSIWLAVYFVECRPCFLDLLYVSQQVNDHHQKSLIALHRGLGWAANSIPLPNPKQRAVREHFIMPLIRRAAKSLALGGLVYGTTKMRSNHSISAMICSASISVSISTRTVASVK